MVENQQLTKTEPTFKESRLHIRELYSTFGVEVEEKSIESLNQNSFCVMN